MEDLKLLSLSDLFDLLMEQTNRHAHLRGSGAAPEQMMTSRAFLVGLQAEIKLRKTVEKENKSKLSSQSAFPCKTAK